MDTRFHCVYLLTSRDPQCEGEYYIGYTVNPVRRLRQHNGELVSGARRTRRRGRPWAIVCCVSGFTEDRVALKFEWCWQHPTESVKLKHTSALLRGLHKLPLAIGTLHLLLHAELFSRLELTLHIFEIELFHCTSTVARSHAVGRYSRAGWQQPTPNTGTGSNAEGPLLTGFSRLVATSLLHIEEITLEAFERKYLFTDRHDDVDGMHADHSLSCPYDISAISQTVLEDWGSAENEPRNTSVSDGCSRTTSVEPGNDSRSELTGWSGTARPRRVPFRFTFFSSADYMREHVKESEQASKGLLACSLCSLPLLPPYIMRCPRAPFCCLRAHLVCLALWMQYYAQFPTVTSESDAGASQREADALKRSTTTGTLIPMQPCPCPLCGEPLHWAALVRELKQRAVAEKRIRQHRRRLLWEDTWRGRLSRISANQRRRLTGQARQRSALSPPSRSQRTEYSTPTAVALGLGDGNGGDALTNERNDESLLVGIPHLLPPRTNGKVDGKACADASPLPCLADESESFHAVGKLLPVTEFVEEEWLNK